MSQNSMTTWNIPRHLQHPSQGTAFIFNLISFHLGGGSNLPCFNNPTFFLTFWHPSQHPHHSYWSSMSSFPPFAIIPIIPCHSSFLAFIIFLIIIFDIPIDAYHLKKNSIAPLQWPCHHSRHPSSPHIILNHMFIVQKQNSLQLGVLAIATTIPHHSSIRWKENPRHPQTSQAKPTLNLFLPNTPGSECTKNVLGTLWLATLIEPLWK